MVQSVLLQAFPQSAVSELMEVQSQGTMQPAETYHYKTLARQQDACIHGKYAALQSTGRQLFLVSPGELC